MSIFYPLSPMQQGILFHSLDTRRTGTYILQIVCALRENLNVQAFSSAWRQVVARHPVLRTRVLWEDLDEPIQEVCPSVDLPIEKYDWRGLPLSEQERGLENYLNTDRSRGFSLAEAPLMRLALFRTAEANYELIWTCHHIILDSRSLALVLREVFAFYEAYCEGHSLELEQPRPYCDYISWLRQQDLSKAEDFWRESLRGFRLPTPIPGRDLPTRLEDGFGEQQIKISAALTSALLRLASEHHLTLGTIVQGAWALLLSQYSEKEDVVFGGTRACRRSTIEGAESMIGLIMNTLPVRVHVSHDKPLLPWLKEIRAEQEAVREYEHAPLVDVQGWSEIPRDLPLFQSLLNFDLPLDSTVGMVNRNGARRQFRLIGQTNYPLTIRGYSGTELVFIFAYDRAFLKHSTVNQLSELLGGLLANFAASPFNRLHGFDVISKGSLRIAPDENANQLDQLRKLRNTKRKPMDLSDIHK